MKSAIRGYTPLSCCQYFFSLVVFVFTVCSAFPYSKICYLGPKVPFISICLNLPLQPLLSSDLSSLPGGKGERASLGGRMYVCGTTRLRVQWGFCLRT